MVYGARFLENVVKLDDPVWAVPCHMMCGLWGLLAVGIFADGTYLEVSGLIDGNSAQIVSQLIAMVTVVAWTAVTSAVDLRHHQDDDRPARFGGGRGSRRGLHGTHAGCLPEDAPVSAM